MLELNNAKKIINEKNDDNLKLQNNINELKKELDKKIFNSSRSEKLLYDHTYQLNYKLLLKKYETLKQTNIELEEKNEQKKIN